MLNTALKTEEVSIETPARREVIERKILGGPFLLSVKVPKQTRNFTAPDGRNYIQFGIKVDGGYVNFHLFGEPNCHGRRARAEATIMEKTMDDGSTFVYVDLESVVGDSTLTHCLKIYVNTKTMPETLVEGSHVFKCTGNIAGCLVVSPL